MRPENFLRVLTMFSRVRESSWKFKKKNRMILSKLCFFCSCFSWCDWQYRLPKGGATVKICHNTCFSFFALNTHWFICVRVKTGVFENFPKKSRMNGKLIGWVQHKKIKDKNQIHEINIFSHLTMSVTLEVDGLVVLNIYFISFLIEFSQIAGLVSDIKDFCLRNDVDRRNKVEGNSSSPSWS